MTKSCYKNTCIYLAIIIATLCLCSGLSNKVFSTNLISPIDTVLSDSFFEPNNYIIRQKQDSLLNLSITYEKTGNYKNSLLYKEKYFSLKDSLNNEEWDKSIEETREVYERKALSDTLELIQMEYKLTQLNYNKKMNRRIALIFIIGFSIIIISVYLFYYRKKIISEKILNEKTFKVLSHNKELEYKNRILELQKEEISEQNQQLSEISSVLDENKNELEKLSYVVKSVSNAIAITDIEGSIIWANNGFIKLFENENIELFKLKEKNIRNCFTNNDLDEIINECINIRSSLSFEIDFKASSGERKHFFTTITPYIDPNDVVDKLIFVNSDILDLKLAKKRLLELNQNLEKEVEMEVKNSRKRDLMIIQQSRNAAMGEMVSNIAHQWKQPLNAISLLVQNFKDVFIEKELSEEYMEKTVNKSMDLIAYMSETIDDFRNFFKTDKEKIDFSINQVVDKALSFLSISFSVKNININKSIEEEVVCKGLPNEYLQVIINILNNAKDVLIERNIENPEILIELLKENKMSVLNISDNAGGIDESILPNVFKIYFSTKKDKAGTGLGLYMSKQIVEKNMKGQLLVKNLEKGACFSIIV